MALAKGIAIVLLICSLAWGVQAQPHAVYFPVAFSAANLHGSTDEAPLVVPTESP